MDDDQIARRLKGLRPLTADDMRRLHSQNRSDEFVAAAWEIRRLQAFVLDAFNRYERGAMREQAPMNLCHFGTQVAVIEPCVQAFLALEWQRRYEPGTRYHHVRDLVAQPSYSVGWDTTASVKAEPLLIPAPNGIRPANRSA
jgi:hypothetical protein